jgi:hypothetical protein
MSRVFIGPAFAAIGLVVLIFAPSWIQAAPEAVFDPNRINLNVFASTLSSHLVLEHFHLPDNLSFEPIQVEGAEKVGVRLLTSWADFGKLGVTLVDQAQSLRPANDQDRTYALLLKMFGHLMQGASAVAPPAVEPTERASTTSDEIEKQRRKRLHDAFDHLVEAAKVIEGELEAGKLEEIARREFNIAYRWRRLVYVSLGMVAWKIGDAEKTGIKKTAAEPPDVKPPDVKPAEVAKSTTSDWFDEAIDRFTLATAEPEKELWAAEAAYWGHLGLYFSCSKKCAQDDVNQTFHRLVGHNLGVMRKSRGYIEAKTASLIQQINDRRKNGPPNSKADLAPLRLPADAPETTKGSENKKDLTVGQYFNLDLLDSNRNDTIEAAEVEQVNKRFDKWDEFTP